MVGSELHLNPHVRAGCEYRNLLVLGIVPLLPDIETSGVLIRSGAAGGAGVVKLSSVRIAERRGLRLPPEVLRHASRPRLRRPHAPFELVPAHRV